MVLSKGGFILTINSVNSFLSEKKEALDSVESSTTIDGRGLIQRLFYRGQSNDFKSSNNVASIFRGKNHSGYTREYSFTNEYMRRYANEFNNLENNFSRLSYMQHFGLPTRLLDVTTNALVALYFACQSHLDSKGHETDGIVTMFISNKTQNTSDYTYYSSRSDTVEILSTLALMDEVKKQAVYKKISCYNEKVEALLKKDENKSYDNWYMDLVKQFPNGNYEELSSEKKQVYDSLSNYYKDINESYEVQCLYQDIKRDTGYFADLINFKTLIHPFFVEPSFNNERLRAQSGFFLFEPYDGTSRSLENIHDDIDKKVSLHKADDEPISLIIPSGTNGTNKKNILKELDQTFGINQATLFPDKENVASYIKNNF